MTPPVNPPVNPPAGDRSPADPPAGGGAVDLPLRPFGAHQGESVQLYRPGAPTAYPPEVRARLETDAAELIGRYPQARSALLPLLHLVQAEDGYITPAGVEFCAAAVRQSPAEVMAVATFYTMYRRRPCGEYLVGVCTNTLCAVLGGDVILADLCEHLGIEPGGTTDDGKVTVEHIECNAACDYAPVIMVNWEFFDDQSPRTARELVDALRTSAPPDPTRGAPLLDFKATARLLAGFEDTRPGAVDASGAGGAPTLAGLIAEERPS